MPALVSTPVCRRSSAATHRDFADPLRCRATWARREAPGSLELVLLAVADDLDVRHRRVDQSRSRPEEAVGIEHPISPPWEFVDEQQAVRQHLGGGPTHDVAVDFWHGERGRIARHDPADNLTVPRGRSGRSHPRRRPEQHLELWHPPRHRSRHRTRPPRSMTTSENRLPMQQCRASSTAELAPRATDPPAHRSDRVSEDLLGRSKWGVCCPPTCMRTTASRWDDHGGGSAGYRAGPCRGWCQGPGLIEAGLSRLGGLPGEVGGSV